ncbi:MAG: anti-sigma factor family protein [Pyrinomonadaceae bacterium]
MNCERIESELALYLDDEFPIADRLRVEEHLSKCPNCRAKLDQFKQITYTLRTAQFPPVPIEISARIRAAIEVAAIRRTGALNSPRFRTFPERNLSEKFHHWLMPYSLGSIAAVIFVFVLFIGLTTTKDAADTIAKTEDSDYTQLIVANSFNSDAFALPGDPPVALEGFTPRINPRGAIYSLATSLANGEVHDEELVLVANVFGNGIATLNQLVKAPKDKHELDEIKAAFSSDPNKAPFLPPTLNQDSKAVKVVVKIQWVNVETNSN